MVGGSLNVLPFIINPLTFFVYLFPMEGMLVLITIEFFTCAICLWLVYLAAKNWQKLYVRIIFYLLILTPLIILALLVSSSALNHPVGPQTITNNSDSVQSLPTDPSISSFPNH
jgi:hypothetical protein